jgi:KipI family sensor histidine kinase inhibitor
MREWEYRLAGDRGVLLKFGDEVNEETFRKVVSFEKKVEESRLPGVLETIRSYCTLFIEYDPSRTNHVILVDRLKQIAQGSSTEAVSFPKKKIIPIPVVYGGAYGPDLPSLARILKMSEEEIIRRHLSHDYLVYITAFLGGTAFFKGTDPIFDVPRKKTPVLLHLQGTVNLANGLGSVLMPLDSPTGWHGLGRSPLRQFYPERNPPVLIKTGDWIRYRRIDEEEFQKIKRKVEEGTYDLEVLDG